MIRVLLALVSVSVVSFGLGGYFWYVQSQIISGAPPYGEAQEDVPESLDPYAWLKNWKRPEGPARVGLQVGHWKKDDLPDELARLRGNTGAQGGGKSEVEVNLVIAQETKRLLEAEGVAVEILPSTVPESYWADVFVAIHADGSESGATSGFKVAGPWRDFTRKSDELVGLIEESYGRATGLVIDPNVSRNMRGYYAFSWWRYDHAIHPMTTAVIVETGFMTSANDRRIIIDQPELSAKGIAEGVVEHLKLEGLVN